MKTKCVLACVVAILAAVSVVRADPYTVADFDGTGNPFQNWGLGSWQGAAQSTLDGSAIGASTNWMEVDMGNLNGSNWNNTNELIMPWYGNWGSWTLDTLNQHSAYAFDVIAIDGTYNSNSLYVKMSADFYAEYGGAQLAPTVNQNWNQVPITLTSVDTLLNNQPATITHVVVPYTDIFPTAMSLFGATDGGQSLQAYWQLSYNPNGTSDDGVQTVFIDNVQLVGPPLAPVPEPATIAMLALAGLMGLLYWRKR